MIETHVGLDWPNRTFIVAIAFKCVRPFPGKTSNDSSPNHKTHSRLSYGY
jgi:hypothetical protein